MAEDFNFTCTISNEYECRKKDSAYCGLHTHYKRNRLYNISTTKRISQIENIIE